MDVGHESKINWPERLIKTLSLPIMILFVAVFTGMAWIIAGISPVYCVLYGLFLGAALMWLFYNPQKKYEIVRVFIYGLIAITLWCVLLEKLSVINGKPCSRDDARYYRNEKGDAQ